MCWIMKLKSRIPGSWIIFAAFLYFLLKPGLTYQNLQNEANPRQYSEQTDSGSETVESAIKYESYSTKSPEYLPVIYSCARAPEIQKEFRPVVVDIPDYPQLPVEDILLPREVLNTLPNLVNDYATTAASKVENLFNVEEPTLINEGYGIVKNSTASMASTFSYAAPETKHLSKKAMINIQVTHDLATTLNLTPPQIMYSLPKLHIEIPNEIMSGTPSPITNSPPVTPPIGIKSNVKQLYKSSYAQQYKKHYNNSLQDDHKIKFIRPSSGYRRKKRQACDSSVHFRSFSGSCNNLNNPNWGRAFIPFLRLLPADYEDGVEAPRSFSKIGTKIPLPSARKISLIIHQDVEALRHDVTHIAMQWGQFIDHDITHTPTTTVNTGNNGQETLDCCRFVRSGNRPHESCIMPILMVDGDPMHSEGGDNCIQFVRSSPISTGLGVREQLNQITAFIDGSQIYGSSEEISQSLRSFRNGQLLSTPSRGQKDLLPQSQSPICPGERDSLRCFRAGDIRVNEQSLLATLQTLWLREHNRIATKLQNINPHWNDEKIFQETRKIVWALIQLITYKEWLPIILGPQTMENFGLSIWPKGMFYTGYNDNINPGIFNEFATAAFRFGHSTVQKLFELRNSSHLIENVIQMTDTFFKPFNLYRRGILDQYVLGMVNQKLMKPDTFMTDGLTLHLFQTGASNFGLDLASLNIQRGRDHGLPGYNKYRKICGLKEALNFNDLLNEMPSEVVRKLEDAYRLPSGEATVNDIDLFTGGLAENPTNGGLLGPVFSCIIGRQFNKLRRGDRFWFENNISPGSFTIEQLDAIRDSSLAGVICENTDTVLTLQMKVFLRASRMNPRRNCKDIPKINLELWRERR